MKGSTPPQIAEIIIKLVKDMAAVSNDFITLSQISFIISIRPVYLAVFVYLA